MRVSIIIPVREQNKNLEECLRYCLELDYSNYEIIVLPDKSFKNALDKIRIIPTGDMGPATKRDIGAKNAEGEILAFLDDDAFPRRDWLRNATKYFNDLEIAAVGGPAITPESDSFAQKVSGAVFLSPLNGRAVERYWPGKKVRDVDDWPSVNLLVRRGDFLAVGGFNSGYWPGEDTKLCLDLSKKLNKKIVYAPDVLVYHHRRAGLFNHLRQIGRYGLHRGFFARKYPENSLKLTYFIPAVFLIFVLGGWIFLFSGEFFRVGYLTIWLIYLFSLLFSAFSIYKKIKDFRISLLTIPYIFLTHLYYGARFIQGFIFTPLEKATDFSR